MSRRFSRASVSALGVVAMSLLIAACGGSGSTGTQSTASIEKSREQEFIALSKCLREHGVNVQAPTASGPFRIRDLRGNRQAFEVARTACKKYFPKFGAANLSPAERVARQEAVRKFAKCMREHGVPLEIETSDAGAPGFGIRIHLGSGGPNRESPAFERAQKSCSGLLPKRPGGGRGFGLGRSGGPGGPGGASGGPPGGGQSGSAQAN